MLTFKNKIKLFTEILSRDELSYADSFNEEIFIFAQNCDFNFLEKLSSQKKIQYWIDKLKSRIVMKEDEAPLEDIVNDYISFG